MNRVVPNTYFYLSLAGMFGLHVVFPVAHILTGSQRVIGIVLIALGLGMAVATYRALAAHQTTYEPFEVPTALISDSVFRLTRNPMYLGAVFLLSGIALFMGSLTPWAGVVSFAVLIDLRIIRAEEEILADQFGAEWLAYKQTTRRWI